MIARLRALLVAGLEWAGVIGFVFGCLWLLSLAWSAVEHWTLPALIALLGYGIGYRRLR